MQKFQSYTTIGTMNDVKKQTLFAISMYTVCYDFPGRI